MRLSSGGTSKTLIIISLRQSFCTNDAGAIGKSQGPEHGHKSLSQYETRPASPLTTPATDTVKWPSKFGQRAPVKHLKTFCGCVGIQSPARPRGVQIIKLNRQPRLAGIAVIMVCLEVKERTVGVIDN